MSTALRLAGFLTAVVAVFGLTFAVGRVAGPVGAEVAETHDAAHASPPPEEEHGGHAAETTPAADLPGGLMVSQDGYTLELADDTLAPGRGVGLDLTITGPDGEPVTAYEVEHEKELHLIAVRRDGSGFQHVHPTRDEQSGTWSTELDLTAGTWRVFADFAPAKGDPLTLGADLSVPGDHRPATSTEEVRTATVGGYEVSLDGDLEAGADAKLALTVTRDGRPVTDLEPYLGAYGHLVALRHGDLAYLHVHPDGSPGDGSTRPGPEVVFHTEVPSDGTYRLYLDFKHDGVVRTAAFAVSAHDHGGSGGH